jgi:hypothetical protein
MGYYHETVNYVVLAELDVWLKIQFGFSCMILTKVLLDYKHTFTQGTNQQE